MHCQMKGRVIILHRTKKPVHADFRRQFLANLPHQCFLWRFASLNLSAGKLSPVFPLTISSLSGEDAALVIMYDGCYYFYLFHV